MEKKTKLQLYGVLILVMLAVVDAFTIFVPVVAILVIILLLFKPRWLYNYIKELYG